MRLSDLLQFNDIVIQCHDNPDADALASGYAIWWFFKQNNKNARFIYRGRNKIQKSNLMIMLSELEIPVSYEPDFSDVPELLVLVDCQAGQRNVTDTPAQTIAVIDHHQVAGPLPELSDLRNTMGSCSTICWDLLRTEGLDANDDELLATALYYGLYTDTNRLSEMAHPLDRDMIDNLRYKKSVITSMINSNISLNELRITGEAITNYEYLEEHKVLFVQAEPCDPCILGLISDFALETESVDICIAFYVNDDIVKLSVRSCTKEVHANELAAFLTEGIGGGGGHVIKAGGMIRAELLPEEAGAYLRHRLEQYYDMYRIMYAKDTTLDTRQMKLYKKRQQALGFIRLTDVFEPGTSITVRTLEGDVSFEIEDFTYLMIGVAGEVWPISEAKLEDSYQITNFKFNKTYEYEPSIINNETHEVKRVLEYARTAMTKSQSKIYAKPLDHAVKLFTAWAEENYYFGNIGDYIVVRQDDEHDIYIVSGKLFDDFYEPA